MSEWKTMETAPRDGTPILALFEWETSFEHVIVRRGSDPDYPWESSKDGYPTERLAYWQPLPAPPVSA